MSRFFNTSLGRLASWASLLVTLCIGVSCSDSSMNDTDVTIPGYENKVGFTLIVSDVPNAVVGSRASRAPGYLGDGYDRGDGYENYIDIPGGDFMFIFFDKDDKYLGVLNSSTVFMLESSLSSKKYGVLGTVSSAIADAGTVKVMVLANWQHAYPDVETLDGSKTIADVCRSVYQFDPAGMLPSPHNPIPLYGITNTIELEFDALNHTDLGTIHLLRAYAKIEVCNAADTNAEIAGVTLTCYNTSGYRAPLDVACQDDYVHGDYNADYTSAPYIPDGVTVAENLPFVHTTDGSFIAYVPEYLNTVGTPASLAVSFVGMESQTPDTVEFKYYQAPAGYPSLQGKPFDLKRNYWYRFNVKKIRDIEVEVIVVPYAETILDPGFGIILPDDPGDIKYYKPVINDRFDDVLYYRNENNACLLTDFKTPIKDPLKNIDPDTGYQMIIADFTDDCKDVLICYYDSVNKVQYAPDKNTPVRTVVSNNDLGLIAYFELDTDTFEYTSESNYYDAINDLWYNNPPSTSYYIGDDHTIYTARGVQVRDSGGNPISFDDIMIIFDEETKTAAIRDKEGKRFVTALVPEEIYEGPQGYARFFEAETENGADDIVYCKGFTEKVPYNKVNIDIYTGLAIYSDTGDLLVVTRRMRTSLYETSPYPVPTTP